MSTAIPIMPVEGRPPTRAEARPCTTWRRTTHPRGEAVSGAGAPIRPLVAALAAACLALAPALPAVESPTGAAPQPAQGLTDIGITHAVENTFSYQDAMSPIDVDVSTDHGIVTLSGSVDNLLDKERAVKLAESVRGVRGVVGLLTVQASPRPDADIRKDIEAALLQDPATTSYQVTVEVANGVATLRGKVASYAERQLADRVAKGVMGVREERSEVAIDYGSRRSDAEIAADIRERLQWDLWLNGDILEVAVKDRKVSLAGLVGSASARTRASDDAWVDGVTAVDAGAVDVHPWARSESRRSLKFAARSDDEIKAAVLATFRQDPRLKSGAPQVAVEDGGVFLSGTLGDLEAKASAERDAKGVVGVGMVDDRVLVRPKVRVGDADIAKQVAAAFAWDPILALAPITVSVGNRVVRLSGTADSYNQMEEAQEIAMRTKGVVLVRNHIHVEPGYPTANDGSAYFDQTPFYLFGANPRISDDQVRKRIERELAWSPLIEKDEVAVAVSGGVATLSGYSGSWIGRAEAVRDARRGGAIDVIDHIEVKKGGWWWP